MSRTGKLFGYQHYDDFEPDYLTFGKGAILSGVAVVNNSKFIYKENLEYITNSVSTELALKGAQVLKRVREDGLIKHAAEMKSSYPDSVIPESSMGLLIY